jgi:DNA-binding transcriptional MerR regulator
MAEKITIEDMQEQSGLTKRTLHSYIQKGLLPGPEKGGRYAYYSKDHLSLLELITKLKDLNFPLGEIKKLTKKLSPQQIQWLNSEEYIKPVNIPDFFGGIRDYDEENRSSIRYIVKLEILHEVIDQILDQNQMFADKSENNFFDECEILIDSNDNIKKYKKEIWHHFRLENGSVVKVKTKDKKLDKHKLLEISSLIKELEI